MAAIAARQMATLGSMLGEDCTVDLSTYCSTNNCERIKVKLPKGWAKAQETEDELVIFVEPTVKPDLKARSPVVQDLALPTCGISDLTVSTKVIENLKDRILVEVLGRLVNLDLGVDISLSTVLGLVDDVLGGVLTAIGYIVNDVVDPILTDVGATVGAILDGLLGKDGLLAKVLGPLIGPDGLVEDLLVALLGDNGVVPTLLGDILGKDGVVDNVVGKDGLVDKLVGQDGVVDNLLNKDGTVNAILSVVLGTDGSSSETVGILDILTNEDRLLGEGGLADQVLDKIFKGSNPAVGDDGLVDNLLGEGTPLGETVGSVLASLSLRKRAEHTDALKAAIVPVIQKVALADSLNKVFHNTSLIAIEYAGQCDLPCLGGDKTVTVSVPDVATCARSCEIAAAQQVVGGITSSGKLSTSNLDVCLGASAVDGVDGAVQCTYTIGKRGSSLPTQDATVKCPSLTHVL